MFHLNFSYYNHKEMKLNIYYGWVGEKGGTTKQAQRYNIYCGYKIKDNFDGETIQS